MNELRQILVMRKDLNMRKGKLVAQGAHASMKAYLENPDHSRFKQWLSGKFTKIAVSVDSEQELFDVMQKAKDKGLITTLVTDAGLTEFHGYLQIHAFLLDLPQKKSSRELPITSSYYEV